MPHAPTLTNPTANIVSARYYDKKGMSRFCTFDKKFVYAVGTDPSGTPTVDKRSFQPLLVANGSACPDPAIGGHKEGAIVYTCTWPNGSTIKKTVIEDEGSTTKISCVGENPPPEFTETIRIDAPEDAAEYGDIGTPSRICNFTAIAMERCNGATSCSFEPHDDLHSLNFICGDPASGSHSKSAVIKYLCQPNSTNLLHTASAKEFGTLTISCPATP
jgi:hypothetical protein